MVRTAISSSNKVNSSSGKAKNSNSSSINKTKSSNSNNKSPAAAADEKFPSKLVQLSKQTSFIAVITRKKPSKLPLKRRNILAKQL